MVRQLWVILVLVAGCAAQDPHADVAEEARAAEVRCRKSVDAAEAQYDPPAAVMMKYDRVTAATEPTFGRRESNRWQWEMKTKPALELWKIDQARWNESFAREYPYPL